MGNANPEAPETVRLADYQPFPFNIDKTHLDFDIRDGETRVVCEMSVARRAGESGAGSERGAAPLELNGVDLALDRLAIDGRDLGGNEYAIDGETLTIFDVPDACTVRVETRIRPEDNAALEGLYKSGALYCTQCEAEGFRKITYYPDRPDVLSRFTTTIAADAAACPVLLSNGNPVAASERDGRRTATWEDPFPKPSYLFALVAGDLELLEDSFVTASGREVALRIYSEPRNIGQCGYAMESLKRAMRWDEERFGREYDLDIFMIVAVEDFNMGAMENKGLNIFNTSCVLATPDTATDIGHQHVEAVVGHEYFHNWSGNRVTCRDWFQLSLKEGFTVYRDAEFSSDMNSRTIKRVADVDFLRSVQFREDAGPLAHPVRPASYVEISNFYTSTVYQKGAEVVRMLDTILGRARFRAGSDAYFDRHDGSAATTEDFVAAMEDAAGVRLPTFRRWYEQAGTPLLTVAERRDGDALILDIAQSCAPSPGQPRKAPFHIPLAFGLVDADGRDALGAVGAAHGHAVAADAVAADGQALRIENPNADGTLVAHLADARATLALRGVPDGAEVSFLRGFSAPVRVDYPRPRRVRRALAARDTDGFARWDAGQTLMAEAILAAVRGESDDGAEVVALARELADAAQRAADDGEARALLAAMLALPQESALLDLQRGADILAICSAREALADRLAGAVDWLALAEANATPGAYRATGRDIARRQLRNRALAYAARHLDNTDAAAAQALLENALAQANNLTDRLAALGGLIGLRSLAEDDRERHLAAFYRRWESQALVVDAWFAVQARCPAPDALQRMKALEAHPAFALDNPNKVRALFHAFTRNAPNFHAEDGAGYDWIGDKVLSLDRFNPQMASRLAKTLTEWRSHDAARGQRMSAVLQRIGGAKLSKDVREVVDKGLASAP